MSIHLVLLNWTVDGSLGAPSTCCFSKMTISISKNLVMKSYHHFVTQLNSVLGKIHETQQEPQYTYSYKSSISFTLNKE